MLPGWPWASHTASLLRRGHVVEYQLSLQKIPGSIPPAFVPYNKYWPKQKFRKFCGEFLAQSQLHHWLLKSTKGGGEFPDAGIKLSFRPHFSSSLNIFPRNGFFPPWTVFWITGQEINNKTCNQIHFFTAVTETNVQSVATRSKG